MVSHPLKAKSYEIGISPNGDMIASARGDGTVWLQSLPNGEIIARMGTNGVTASSLAFSMDGTLARCPFTLREYKYLAYC